MFTIRLAKKKDKKAIQTILSELDLARPGLTEENFWVACANGTIGGIAHIEEFESGIYLSAVGVSNRMQGRGIASQLLNFMFSRLKERVYIHTKIPIFFRKFGFEVAALPPDITVVDSFDCVRCSGATNCVCMVRPPDAT